MNTSLRETFTAKNVSGEEIPPYACVQLVPVDGEFVGQVDQRRSYFAVSKPSYLNNGPYAINGPNKVVVNGYGEFRRPASVPCLALLNEYLYLEDAWDLVLGPVDGEWYLDAGSGFTFGGVFPYFPEPQVGFVLLDSDSGLVEVEITQLDDDPYDYDYDYYDPDEDGYYEEAAAIYRTSHPNGFSVRRLDCNGEMTGDEITCYADNITGVHWTGSRVTMRKDDCGKWQIVNSGNPIFRNAVALEAIDADAFGMIELFPDGPIVECTTPTGVAITTPIRVVFNEDDQTFEAWLQDCPPAPSESP